MEFPFRDFWSRLTVKFGAFTYKSAVSSNPSKKGLLVESEHNAEARPSGEFCEEQMGDFLQSPIVIFKRGFPSARCVLRP